MKIAQSTTRSIRFLAAGGICGLAFYCSILAAEPLSLTLSGSLTSSIDNGVNLGAGTYTLGRLAGAGAVVGTSTADGFTGVPLWQLLGGNSAGASDVLTDSGKNAILRSYVVATTSSGFQSVTSLGELDPFFGGAASKAPFVAYAGTDGNASLIFPGAAAAGRNLNDLSSLQVLSVPALPSGPGGQSTALTLSGNVSQPGIYNLASLQSLPTSKVTIGGDTYTGVPLSILLSPNNPNVFSQYVLAAGTDGYEALFSLAELTSGLGAGNDLVAYADTAGQFPADRVARVVIPGDNHAGRYVSNLDALAVESIPEPGTTALAGFGMLTITALGGLSLRYRTRPLLSAPAEKPAV